MGDYDNPDGWEGYCRRLMRHGWPKSKHDAMRVTMPDLFANMSDNWSKMFGEDYDEVDTPYDPENFAETRVPLARAGTAIKKVKNAKRPATKRKYLEQAKWWLEHTHPWMGPKTAKQIEKQLASVRKQLDRLPVD